MQERITSTLKGSITSVQAIYVPADDLTDPSPATTFSHLDATTVLSRQVAELGFYPAVDPLESTSRNWTQISSVPPTTTSLEMSRKSFKITNLSKISLPFWVWVNCPLKR